MTESEKSHEIPKPQIERNLLLPESDEYWYGCGGAVVGPDGGVYVLPKITAKTPNSRGANPINHGLIKLDPTGIKIAKHLSQGVLQEYLPEPIEYEPENGNPGDKNHWAYYTDFSLSTPIQYEEEGVKASSPRIQIAAHPGFEGHEDARITKLDNGPYIVSSVKIDARDWWAAGWRDKTSRIKGCRLTATMVDDISDPHSFQETSQFGPDFVIRNAFFTHEVIEKEGKPHLRLIYRDLPGEHPGSIYQSVLDYATLIRLSSDPKFREEFWRSELSDERKKETRLMSPAFHWEAVRAGAEYGHGQIASGCTVKINDRQTLLITGSPPEIDAEGVTRGRVIGLTLLETDENDPSIIRVVSRASEPFLTPQEEDERIGKVNDVVFSTGACVVQDQCGEQYLNLYYTGADSCFKVARSNLGQTLAWLGQFDECGNIR